MSTHPLARAAVLAVADAADVGAALVQRSVRVIDLSGAFRIRSEADRARFRTLGEANAHLINELHKRLKARYPDCELFVVPQGSRPEFCSKTPWNWLPGRFQNHRLKRSLR